jgi:hypothetical protein
MVISCLRPCFYVALPPGFDIPEFFFVGFLAVVPPILFFLLKSAGFAGAFPDSRLLIIEIEIL